MAEVYVETTGGKLWTIIQGAGLPVMLCNGGPGCADYLQPVANMIVDMATVVRFEQRGCGRSDHAASYDVAACLRDLDTIRQHYGFTQWVIGGHSWGADLALFYALTYPQTTTGLICLSGGRVHNDREWHTIYRERKEAEGEAIPPAPYPPNMEVNQQVNQSAKQYIQQPELFRNISQLAVPALFLYGKQDIRPSWPVEQVAHLMPNAQFVHIHDAPHVLWLTQSPTVKNHLRTFLAAHVAE